MRRYTSCKDEDYGNPGYSIEDIEALTWVPEVLLSSAAYFYFAYKNGLKCKIYPCEVGLAEYL